MIHVIALNRFDQRHDIFDRRIGLCKMTGARQIAIGAELIQAGGGFRSNFRCRAEGQYFLVFDTAMKDQLLAVFGFDLFAIHPRTNVLNRVEYIDSGVDQALNERLCCAISVEKYLGSV